MTSGFLSTGLGINTTQPNLQSENHIFGSVAREVSYVAPEPWTVYVFIASAGFLLVIGWGIGIWAGKRCTVEKSCFPMIDLVRLRCMEESGEWRDDFGEILRQEILDDDGGVISLVRDKVVKLKTE